MLIQTLQLTLISQLNCIFYVWSMHASGKFAIFICISLSLIQSTFIFDNSYPLNSLWFYVHNECYCFVNFWFSIMLYNNFLLSLLIIVHIAKIILFKVFCFWYQYQGLFELLCFDATGYNICCNSFQ